MNQKSIETIPLKPAVYFLLLLYLMLKFYPLFDTGFVTNDDANAAMGATWSSIFNTGIALAKSQGRFFFLFEAPLSIVPYLIKSFLFFKIVCLSAFILNFFLILFVVQKFVRSEWLTLAVGIMLLTAFQVMWHETIYVAYPFIFQMGFSFFLTSLLTFQSYLERGGFKLGLLVGFLFFLSMLTYEAFIPYCLVFVIIGSAWSLRKTDSDYGFKISLLGRKFIRIILPIAVSTISYLVIYILFRQQFPTHYDGVTMGDLSVERMLHVIWQWSISSLPGYSFLHDDWAEWATSYRYLGDIKRYGLKYAPFHTWAAALIATILTFILFAIKKREFVNWRMIVLGLLLGLVFYWAPCMPYSLSIKYQNYVERGVPAGRPTYLSMFGVSIIAGQLFYLIDMMSRKRIWIRIGVASLLALAVGLLALMTSVSNWHISRSMAISHSKWTAVNQFIDSPFFLEIPEGATIIAPGLYEGINIMQFQAGFWDQYFAWKSGKTLSILPDFPLHSQKFEKPVYLLRYVRSFVSKNYYFVFAKLRDLSWNYGQPSVTADRGAILLHSTDRNITIHGLMSENRIANSPIEINGQSVYAVNNALRYSLDLHHSAKDLATIDLMSKDLDFNSLEVSAFRGPQWSYQHIPRIIYSPEGAAYFQAKENRRFRYENETVLVHEGFPGGEFFWGIRFPAISFGDRFSIHVRIRSTPNQVPNAAVFGNHPGPENFSGVVLASAGKDLFGVGLGDGTKFFGPPAFEMSPEIDHTISFSFDAGQIKIFMDGVLRSEIISEQKVIKESKMNFDVGNWSNFDRRFSGKIYEILVERSPTSAAKAHAQHKVWLK